jgi:hypothetical protein
LITLNDPVLIKRSADVESWWWLLNVASNRSKPDPPRHHNHRSLAKELRLVRAQAVDRLGRKQTYPTRMIPSK